jgi:hypothetical protein
MYIYLEEGADLLWRRDLQLLLDEPAHRKVLTLLQKKYNIL